MQTNWVSAICVVHFDLSLGQQIERVLPFPESLSEKDSTSVANMAFPDSNSFVMGDVVFTFRFRSSNGEFKYGFSMFRQKPDPTLQRGYFQKAVVIISSYPFIRLLERTVSIMGSMYFKFMDVAVLESAVHCISSQWTVPEQCVKLGKKVDLPFMGTVFTFEFDESIETPLVRLSLPNGKVTEKFVNRSDFEFVSIKNLNIRDVQGSFRFVNVYKRFRKHIGNLWFLWELAITGQPILVVANSCNACSRAVFGIMSLIAPLSFKGDFRPFFTVFDVDYKHFEDMYDHETLPSVILGVTNPFLLKRFEKFPHIIVLGSSIPNETTESKPMQFFTHSRKSSKTENIIKDISKAPVSSSGNTNITFASKGTPLLSPNKEVLKRLLDDPAVHKDAEMNKMASSDNVLSDSELKSDDEQDEDFEFVKFEDPDFSEICKINNKILRNHFLEMTTRFLAPFEFFFKAIWPSSVKSDSYGKFIFPKNYNPYVDCPKFPRFNESKFLKKIEEMKSDEIEKHFSFHKSPRSSLKTLYEKFFKSPHFAHWYSIRRESAMRKTDEETERCIMQLDLLKLVDGMLINAAVQTSEAITAHLQKYLSDTSLAEDKSQVIDKMKHHLKQITEVIQRFQNRRKPL
jgi:hypothetical protein